MTLYQMRVSGRFNRNIVECKGTPGKNLHHMYGRFNRNIVECKVAFCLIEFFLKCDLIETSWNVKVQMPEDCGIIFLRFNRNIVECKDFNLNDSPTFSKRFNRNIVECKVTCTAG